MSGSYTAKELAEMLNISRRRVYQLVQKGIIERSPDGLFDKTALSAYLQYLRQSIAYYAGKTRGNPSAKPKEAPLSPEERETREQRIAAHHAELDRIVKSLLAMKKSRLRWQHVRR